MKVDINLTECDFSELNTNKMLHGHHIHITNCKYMKKISQYHHDLLLLSLNVDDFK